MQDILNRAANPWRTPKLEKIFRQLGALAQRQKTAEAKATPAEAGTADEERRAQVERDEELVRQVLALFNIDYDGLISMDGNSSYHQAVRANPELAKQVAEADRPVLEALKAAIAYQPYAEFAARYGTTPEEIKKNLREELAANAAPAPVEAAPRAPVGPVFSAYPVGSRLPADKPRAAGDLASLFGR